MLGKLFYSTNYPLLVHLPCPLAQMLSQSSRCNIFCVYVCLLQKFCCFFSLGLQKSFFFVFVLVILTALVERISVSCVQDFLFNPILLEIFDHPIFNQTTMRALKRHCGFQPIQAETFVGKP